MRQKSTRAKDPAEQVVRDIRRRTRKQYSAGEKIRIVLAGLRGEIVRIEALTIVPLADNRTPNILPAEQLTTHCRLLCPEPGKSIVFPA